LHTGEQKTKNKQIGTYEQHIQGDGYILFGKLPCNQEPFEVFKKGSATPRLCKVVLVIARKSVIFYNSLYKVLHIRHLIIIITQTLFSLGNGG
jgi:hypothetical protein